MFFIGLFAVGIGWVVASLHVYLRDTAQMLSVVLTFWFWLTPIMFTEKQFPQTRWARLLLHANPMFYVVRAYRRLLLTPGQPYAADAAVLAAGGAAVFILGGLFFRHMKRGFADVL
jgi:lipopolysaccharide transport system permease protein